MFLGVYSSDFVNIAPNIEKAGKSFDFPALVDYTGKISNFFDDLEKLDRFAESIENELLNLMIEKAES